MDMSFHSLATGKVGEKQVKKSRPANSTGVRNRSDMDKRQGQNFVESMIRLQTTYKQ